MPVGRLYLLPVPLTQPEQGLATLSPASIEQARRLSHFVVENPKSARQFLRAIQHPQPLPSLSLQTLSVQTRAEECPALLQPLLQGHDMGLLSEAGCPAVADPGSLLVSLAHERGITVVPTVGPSALLLGLMASGLNGQRFAFHGYLPVAEGARHAEIGRLEQESARLQQTQIIIETPYRNPVMWAALCATLKPTTLLTVARDLGGAGEWVKTMTVAAWRTVAVPELQRIPAVFLWLAVNQKPLPESKAAHARHGNQRHGQQAGNGAGATSQDDKVSRKRRKTSGSGADKSRTR